MGHILSKNFYNQPFRDGYPSQSVGLIRGRKFLLGILLRNQKIIHHEKYTLSYRSDTGCGLAIGFLCIQCRWLNTYFDCTGRYFTSTWPNAQHIVLSFI